MLVPTRKHPFANQVNAEIAATLGAEIVLVATPGTDNPAQLKERIEVACSNFGARTLVQLLANLLDHFS